MEAILQQQSFWIAVIVAVFAVVAIFAVKKYQSGIKMGIKTKRAEMSLEGSNPAPQAESSSTIKNIESAEGGVRYGDTTGQPLEMDGVKAKNDIDISRSKGGDVPSKK